MKCFGRNLEGFESTKLKTHILRDFQEYCNSCCKDYCDLSRHFKRFNVILNHEINYYNLNNPFSAVMFFAKPEARN